MKKTRIAFFLSLVFLSLIVTPGIISSIDKDFSFTMSFDINDEENKGNKNIKLFEFDDFQPQLFSNNFNRQEDKVNFNHYSKTYKSFKVALHSPPPEFS